MISGGTGRDTSSSPSAHESFGTSVIGTSFETAGAPSSHSPQSALGRATTNVIIANKIATIQEEN